MELVKCTFYRHNFCPHLNWFYSNFCCCLMPRNRVQQQQLGAAAADSSHSCRQQQYRQQQGSNMRGEVGALRGRGRGTPECGRSAALARPARPAEPRRMGKPVAGKAWGGHGRGLGSALGYCRGEARDALLPGAEREQGARSCRQRACPWRPAVGAAS